MSDPKLPRDRSQTNGDPSSQIPSLVNIPDGRDGGDEGEDVLSSWFDVARRRWKYALLVGLTVFGVTAAVTLSQRKIYQSSTKLVVVTKTASQGGGGGEEAGLLSTLSSLKEGRNVDTQVEIIDSPDLIDSAFKRLSPKDRAVGFRHSSAQSWTYEIKSKADTDVIIITTRAYEPRVAAEFANAIAETYLDQDLDRNSRATQQAADYVAKEKGKTEQDLRKAAQKLAVYQRQTNLIAAPDQVSAIAANEIELEGDYQTALGDKNAVEKRLVSLGDQIQSSAKTIELRTDVTENPELTLVRGEIVQLEGELTAKKQEFQPDAVEIKAVEDQLKEQRAKMGRLVKTLVTLKESEANPVRLQLLQDFSIATTDSIVATTRLKELSDNLERVKGILKGFPDQIRQLAEFQQRVDVLNRTFNLLSDKYYTLLIEVQSSLANGLIAARARPAGAASSPRVPIALALALVLGLLSAVVMAVIWEKLDTRVHQPEEIEKLTRLPVLSLIPEASSTTKRLIIGEAEPMHGFLESFRLLRSNTAFAAPDRQLKLLAVTSAAMSEGKSTISMNLAIALGMDGKRVLIIDADLRRPSVHKLAGIEHDTGFTSVVRDVLSLSEAVVPTEWQNLSALSSGPLPPDPTEFLNSQRSKAVFAAAAEAYDVVIVDAPPCTGLSDMQVISTIVDGVVFVASLDSTSRPMIYAAMRMLNQANAPLLGTVINRMKSSNRGYYGYYSYYGYYYYYYGYNAYDEASDEGGASKKRKGKRGR